jgi:hypothetical protein
MYFLVMISYGRPLMVKSKNGAHGKQSEIQP